MFLRRAALVLSFVCLITAATRADPESDEQLLRKAGLDTGGPALLKFLKSFAPSADAIDSIADLVRQLGSDEFFEREEALSRLLAFGPRAAPLLRQAVRDPDREL